MEWDDILLVDLWDYDIYFPTAKLLELEHLHSLVQGSFWYVECWWVWSILRFCSPNGAYSSGFRPITHQVILMDMLWAVLFDVYSIMTNSTLCGFYLLILGLVLEPWSFGPMDGLFILEHANVHITYMQFMAHWFLLEMHVYVHVCRIVRGWNLCWSTYK